MSESKQRKVWIDVVKGIAILFIVLYHHPKGIQDVLFAVPVFFFISGYLFNPDVSSGFLLRKRFNTILRPYLFTVIAISVIYIIFKGKPFFLWYIFWTIYGNAPNLPKLALHLWFLPTLFVTTVLAWFVLNYIRGLRTSLIIQCLFICGFFVLGFLSIHFFSEIRLLSSITDFFGGRLFIVNGLLENPMYPKAYLLNDNYVVLKGLPWGLDGVFLATAFFVSGYVTKIHNIDWLFRKHAVALLAILVIIVFNYFYDYRINFPERRYDHLLMCTVMALAGIYIMSYAANVIGNWGNIVTRTLQYFGKYSLIIFIFHNAIQSKVYYILMNSFSNISYIAIILSFTASICFSLLLNYLLLERFKFFRFWYYAK